MDSPQEIALRIRKHSSHSRDTNRGPLKATEPIPSNQRRFSEVVPRERPPSRRGRRASAGNFVTGNTSPSGLTSNAIQAQRPLSSHSLDNESISARRALMLQRQNATTVDPDSQVDNVTLYENVPRTPPRPPSQPRPSSAKGRPRSGSHLKSGSTGVNVASVLSHSPISFSKYRPLPSIGSRPSSGSRPLSGSNSSNQRYDKFTQHCYQTLDKTLSKKVDELSLVKKHTVPSEPSDLEPNRIHLAIKVLDGSRHERWFRQSDSVGNILAFAESVMREKLPDNCEICTNDLPRRTFSDLSATIKDIGLESRTVLYIQEQ